MFSSRILYCLSVCMAWSSCNSDTWDDNLFSYEVKKPIAIKWHEITSNGKLHLPQTMSKTTNLSEKEHWSSGFTVRQCSFTDQVIKTVMSAGVFRVTFKKMHIMTVDKQRSNEYPIRSKINKAWTSNIKHNLRMERGNLLDPKSFSNDHRLTKNYILILMMTKDNSQNLRCLTANATFKAALTENTNSKTCVTENKDYTIAFFGITWHPWSV